MSESEVNRNSSAGRAAATPIIPDHRLLRRIGRGSYGEVWLALNAMNKWTAVKVVHRQAEDDRRAYEQEFRGLRRYDDLSGNDGSLMPIKNVGENVAGGYFYYAMELADDAETRRPLPHPPAGVEDRAAMEQLAADYRPWTLSEELRRHGALKPQDCVEYGLALAQSLQVLHQGGLVHRDVKPSNIIFVNGRPKLADVGLVASTDATMNSFAGTSGFVPLHGAGEPTGDLFALGKVLYMAATGNDVGRFPQAISNFERLPEDERRKIAELQAVYERACDPLPADRQPSAQALRDELEMLRRNESVVRLRQLEEERELFEKQRQATRRRRKRFAVLTLAATVVVLMVVSALLAYTWRLRTAHEAAVAELEASQLSRMLVRRAGWSETDWERIEKAAARKLDDKVMSQAASILAGLDARVVREWTNVEASSAAFAPDGRALLAGFGTNRAMLISDGTNRTELPVIGEGQACWSPEGNPLIWQWAGNTGFLREARTGKVRIDIQLAPGQEVAMDTAPGLAVSRDGSFVAAAIVQTNGARVKVWDAQDGRLLGEADRSVRALSFSPDGSLLAAGDENGKVTVWRISPFAVLAELPPGKRPNPINCFAFGEDRVVPRTGPGETKSWLLAVGDAGAGIVIWDLTKRLPRTFCPGSDYNIQSLAFSPDGLTLASGGRGGVRIWDAMTGAQLLLITVGFGSDTPALAFDVNGNRLVAGANAHSGMSSVALVELEPHRGVHRLRGLNAIVRKVWISPDSRLIAALSDDWSLAVWETASGHLRHLYEAPAGNLADNAGGAFDAAGNRFGFAAGREARLYDLESGGTLEQWHLPQGFSEEVQFDAQGRLLLVRRERSRETTNAWVWTLYELPLGRAATVLHQQADFSYRIISMTFPLPASRFLAITKDRATGLNSVRAFEVASGGQSWRVEQQRTNPWDLLRTSAGGRWCGFGVGTGGRMQFVQAADGAPAFALPEPCQAMSFDGNEYASLGLAARQWVLRRVDDSELPINLSFDAQLCGDTMVFSSDGRHVGWGNLDGTVFLAKIAAVRQRLSALRR